MELNDEVVNANSFDWFECEVDYDMKADLVLTDVPYLDETIKGSRGNRKGGPKANIKFAAWSKPQTIRGFDLMARLAKTWIVAFVDIWQLPILKEYPPMGFEFIRAGCWVAPGKAPQYTGDRPGQGWEAIAVLHREGKKSWNGGGRHMTFNYPVVRGKAKHGKNPTEKPLALGQELVELFTNPGDLVIDPFCGTGTFLVSALSKGRRAYGCEMNQTDADIAAERVETEVPKPDPRQVDIQEKIDAEADDSEQPGDAGGPGEEGAGDVRGAEPVA